MVLYLIVQPISGDEERSEADERESMESDLTDKRSLESLDLNRMVELDEQNQGDEGITWSQN